MPTVVLRAALEAQVKGTVSPPPVVVVAEPVRTRTEFLAPTIVAKPSLVQLSYEIQKTTAPTKVVALTEAIGQAKFLASGALPVVTPRVVSR